MIEFTDFEKLFILELLKVPLAALEIATPEEQKNTVRVVKSITEKIHTDIKEQKETNNGTS